MTIGNDLDEQFIMIAQRLATLESNQDMFAFQIDTKDLRREVGDLNTEAATFATYTQLQNLEAELNDRIDEAENFDPDDLRYDLESQMEDLRDNLSYHDDRLDEVEAYKCDENEVESIVERMLDDQISDAVTDAVCDEINTRAVGWTEYSTLRDRVKELERFFENPNESLILDKVHDCVCAETEVLCRRVKELEDRLNKPSITARVMRWLREGPSIKETATSWYAGIRRGS